MSYTLILHIQNSDSVVGEVDEMPSPADSLIAIRNPRRIDGKDLNFISENVITLLWPIDKLNFIEVLTGDDEEKIFGFVRE